MAARCLAEATPSRHRERQHLTQDVGLKSGRSAEHGCHRRTGYERFGRALHSLQQRQVALTQGRKPTAHYALSIDIAHALAACRSQQGQPQCGA